MGVDIDEMKLAGREVNLWLGWTLATAAGMLLGFLPFIFLITILELWLARLIVPLWAGFLVGIFQWLVLRRYLTRCTDLILNDVAGWALGYAVGLMVIQALSESILGALVGYGLFGLIVAVLQYPVLRREMPNALPWIIASVLGWSLGAVFGQLVLNLIAPAGEPISQLTSTLVISGITGLVAGAITALALVWIVRQPEAGLE
jgi:hypothetical protein